MAEFLVDSYSESNRSNSDNLTNNTSVWKGGQSFTAIAGKLSSCKFYLQKVGLPTGNAVAELYAHSGTYGTSSVGTGSVLATSGTYNIEGLTTSWQLITFTFTGANQVTLINGTYYVLVLSYSSGDGTKYVQIGLDNTSPGHGGNYIEYTATTWSALNTNDTCFYVYAIPIIAGGFSGGQPWIFMKDMWEKHNKLWIPKLSEGFSI